MDDPERLRAHAVRLFALATDAREINSEFADKLVAQAMELQVRATATEEAAKPRPPPDGTPPPAQQQEQVQPKKTTNRPL